LPQVGHAVSTWVKSNVAPQAGEMQRWYASTDVEEMIASPEKSRHYRKKRQTAPCLTSFCGLFRIACLVTCQKAFAETSQHRRAFEAFMNRAELKVYKDLLLRLRARLHGDVAHLQERALRQSRTEAAGDLSSMPIHMADIGSDNYEQEFSLSLMQNDGMALEKIQVSLDRIEDGTYGSCEECGAKIPKTRLNAIPYSTHCVKCASLQEDRS
jgi:DnaK suppressor protein